MALQEAFLQDLEQKHEITIPQAISTQFPFVSVSRWHGKENLISAAGGKETMDDLWIQDFLKAICIF